MRPVFLIILIIIGLLLAPTSGSASTTGAFRIGDWVGHAYRDDHTRQFEYCAAQTTNDNGITIIYSLDRHYVWSFEISNPSWRFVRGASFQIMLRLNKNKTIGQRAYAISNNLVRVNFADSLEAFTRLSRTLQIDVIFGALISHFNLSHGPDVLVALTRCVVRYGRSSRQLKNFNLVSRTKPGSPIDLIGGRDSATLAAKIVKLVGVKGAKVVRQNETTLNRKADVLWKIGPLLFGVRALAPDQAPKLNGLPAAIIDRDFRTCRRGEFFAGATFQHSDLLSGRNTPRIARVYTSCQIPGTRTSIYYIATPRKRTGIYLLATIGRGSEFSPAIERAAKNFNDGILSVLGTALK